MLVVDVETTGIFPHLHSLASIGAVDFANPLEQFYGECRIWDAAEITNEALAINGFTRENLRDPSKKSVGKLLDEFFSWVNVRGKKMIAGENPHFDREFLRFSAQKLGIPFPFQYRTLDVHSLSYYHHIRLGREVPERNGRKDITLDHTLCFVGLPEEPRPHHALTGAKLEAEALSRLIYGKCLLKEYSQHTTPDYLR